MIKACGSHTPSRSCGGLDGGSSKYVVSGVPDDFQRRQRQLTGERPDRQEYFYLSSRDAFSRRAFRHKNHLQGHGNHSLWHAAPADVAVRGVLAPATTATQPARRLPAPTASAKGPNDSCRVVGETRRAPPTEAESRAPRDMAAAVLTSAQQGQGATTPEASRRVQRALLKLELPDWFLQYYRPPRRDAGSRLGNDGVQQWPKWRGPSAKDAKGALRTAQTATTTLPADRRNLVIPKRVTFREKGSSRNPARPWAYRSLRTPYLGWRSAEQAAASPTPHQAAAVR